MKPSRITDFDCDRDQGGQREYGETWSLKMKTAVLNTMRRKDLQE